MVCGLRLVVRWCLVNSVVVSYLFTWFFVACWFGWCFFVMVCLFALMICSLWCCCLIVAFILLRVGFG